MRKKKILLFLIIVILSAGLFIIKEAKADPESYLTGYTTRKKLTIDQTKIDADLSNFPVRVYLNADSDIGAVSNSDGFDIRFTSSDGTTLLKYEREDFSIAAGKATGNFWVKVPFISSSVDTDIYIYYRVEDTVDGADPTNVWDSNFKSVYHFTETSGNYLDSTTTNNDCSSVNVNSRTATGQIGVAPDFEAANASHRIGCGAINNIGDVTQEAWINLESGGTRPIIQHAALGETEATNITYGLEILTAAPNNNLWQQWEYGAGINATNTSIANVPTGSLTYVVAVKDTTNNQVIWYVNGVASGSATSYTNEATGGTTGSLYIGARITSGQWFDGIIDEVRISGAIRSANWIKASYNSENDSLLIYGAEEVEGSDVFGWAWSENIGWISFNCLNTGVCGSSNYGVSVDSSTGMFSGYAWAGGGEDTYFVTPTFEAPMATIGWIKLDPVGPYPATPNRSACLDLPGAGQTCDGVGNNTVSGWARACAVFSGNFCSGDLNLKPNSERGGWDGWIKLKGTAQDGSPYGVILEATTDEFYDWAWGGDDTDDKAAVIGWITFNCKDRDICGPSNYKVQTNFAPKAINLGLEDIDYCGKSEPPVILNWEFSDTGGDIQDAYQVQLDDDSDVATDPLIDSCIPALGTCSSGHNSESYTALGLNFGTQYWWQVKVWDDKGLASEWGSEDFTTDSRFPNIDFTWTPGEIVIDEGVQFSSDLTTCYPSCSSWAWDFDTAVDADGDTIPDNDIQSTEQNPFYTYTEAKDYTVKLTVEDKNGNSCSEIKDLKVKMPIPTWKEIAPSF